MTIIISRIWYCSQAWSVLCHNDGRPSLLAVTDRGNRAASRDDGLSDTMSIYVALVLLFVMGTGRLFVKASLFILNIKTNS